MAEPNDGQLAWTQAPVTSCTDAGGGGGGESPGDQVDPSVPLICENSNQLTLLFQGKIYVFESVTPEKVQAVLLLLGGSELPEGITGAKAPVSFNNTEKDQNYEDVLKRTDVSAKRVESLIRYQEKRKGRNFDKKIRYAVRKEVALSMQRNKGKFAGRGENSEGETSTPGGETPDVSLKDWKCQNCGIGRDMTPTLRRGPAGPRSLCNACGLNWANKGVLRSISKTKIPIRSPTYSFQGQQQVHYGTPDESKPIEMMDDDMQQEIDEALKN
ncbi:hypothetical protein LUZ60_005280 [Juncus effusus]|nr:hypothetical protein LUZ60_005280 [Juncus effusus]